MTRQTTVNWLDIAKEWKIIDADKAVTTPAKYRHNDNRRTKTTRHNKSVLFRRG